MSVKKETTTDRLEKVLENVSVKGSEAFLKTYDEKLYKDTKRAFTDYMRTCMQRRKINQSSVFNRCGMSAKYGFELLAGRKHTVNRDYLIEIAYLSKMDYLECDKALELYGMNRLNPRVKRDTVIIIGFNSLNRRDLSELDALLLKHGLEELKKCEAIKCSGECSEYRKNYYIW